MPPTLVARNISCSRVCGAETEQIVDLSVAFEPATLNLLFGPEHGGKALLLRVLGLLQEPSRGEVTVLKQSTDGWDETQRREFRNRHFGFVFQSPFLLPSFTVVENIAMPLLKLTGAGPEQARQLTRGLLALTGLTPCEQIEADRLPLALQLRVAVARALAVKPAVIFVENLDSFLRNEELISFLELLAAVRQRFQCCLIATASSRELAPYANRAIEIADGRIARDWNPGGLLA